MLIEVSLPTFVPKFGWCLKTDHRRYFLRKYSILITVVFQYFLNITKFVFETSLNKELIVNLLFCVMLFVGIFWYWINKWISNSLSLGIISRTQNFWACIFLVPKLTSLTSYIQMSANYYRNNWLLIGYMKHCDISRKGIVISRKINYRNVTIN